MQQNDDFSAIAQALIKAGHFFFQRGWVPATSGNFSARIDNQQIAITVSGRHKGQLTEADIMLVDEDGHALSADKKPSAETLLHTTLYNHDSSIGAVFHTHSVNATVLSLLCKGELRLRDYEVLKAFPTIDSHESQVMVPVFANDQNMHRLAATVLDYKHKRPHMQGYLIAGHGFYTWGTSLQDACRHIEAFEFLFECETLMRRMR
jgi:methylthioribulose-1-phosphate dehydratase